VQAGERRGIRQSRHGEQASLCVVMSRDSVVVVFLHPSYVDSNVYSAM